MRNYLATREIGIDAAHRVPSHGSKCRNIHGHRYTIQAAIKGALADGGEQDGMVLDFGFLKDEMMDVIDRWCDHGLILCIDDPMLPTLLPDWKHRIEGLLERVQVDGYHHMQFEGLKFYFMRGAPTAENLAAHWYERLAPRVDTRSDHRAQLAYVKVWETPNCWAQFPA